MAINKASKIVVKRDQLPDVTTVPSLAISLSRAGVTQMHRMTWPEVRVVATKAMAIRAMVMFMVLGVGRAMVRPMLWLHVSSRGI